jgi:1-deoxyxylulose-5-phosphate synthase
VPTSRDQDSRAFTSKAGARAETDGAYADLLYGLTAEVDRAIVDAVGTVAEARGVSRAQVALAWLHSRPVVTAPLVGASSTQQIDDAVASLDLELTEDELLGLERRYTPRYDWQGVSDEAELDAIRQRIPGMAL